MRLGQFPGHRFMGVALLFLIAHAQQPASLADEPGDPFKANTVWQGKVIYDKTDYAPRSKPSR